MKKITILFIVLTFLQIAFAVDNRTYVTTNFDENYFPLYHDQTVAPIVASSSDYSGLKTIAGHFQKDVERVTGRKTDLVFDSLPEAEHIIVVGTIGKSKIIDKLVAQNKLNTNSIINRWDTFLIEIVENPFPNCKSALVIAGSNKRGTFYGLFDLSAQMGVSPWYWWADVPVEKKDELYVLPGSHTAGEPAVKYRGIFLNDEEPCLGRWAVENYDGFKAGFYEKLFELMLRLKANYLWPAMWWASFNSDDPQNPILADEYGIVMGTTHHEPMNRAHAEWRASKGGPWNYETNKERLQQFWRDGIERMGDYETIVTLAMRGDGDMGMSEDTNIALLEEIVKDQREILTEITQKDLTETPQLWALYKEVQDYYDKGMRVPDDVTLLLCDDNWGNLRKLPLLTDKPRQGGYGIYYHFDYVGAPRNYKWVNTTQIEKTWEQMTLAYEYGVDRIWLVNVGDLKPNEFPIEFFLDLAWNPKAWPADRLSEYSVLWAEKQFGEEYALEIAQILDLYTKYNARKKHELLKADTYSLTNYREFELVVNEFNTLTKRAEKLYEMVPPEYKDAFYQLVLHPVKASANLNDLYFVVAKNRLYAKQGRALTNELAETAQKLFEKDTTISHYYNKIMSGGKWNNMMNQTHISYTIWQQPEKDVLPKVETIDLPQKADLGVAVEGYEGWWPNEKENATLSFDSMNRQKFYIELFNRGLEPLTFTIKPKKSWVTVSEDKGIVTEQKRVCISIDWEKVPQGITNTPILIKGAKSKITLMAGVNNTDVLPQGFVENNGVVSMEAHNFSRKVDVAPVRWQLVPNLGKTGSAMIPLPMTSEPVNLDKTSPRLEYDFALLNDGDIDVNVFVSPTQNFHSNQGLRFAVSIDDEQPQIINIHKDDVKTSWQYAQWWMDSVADQIRIKTSKHNSIKAGNHTLKLWMIDSAVVFQKIVIDSGGLKPSYLGPKESKKIGKE